MRVSRIHETAQRTRNVWVGVKTVKVGVGDLGVGMFVAKLDRPWTQTPFPLQGFYIRDADEIKDLQSHCRFVYIDIIKGDSPTATKLRSVSPGGDGKGPIKNLRKSARKVASNVSVAALKIRRNVYTEKTPLKKEVRQAQVLHSNVFKAIGDVMEQVDGDVSASIIQTKRAASEMVDSVIRNPDAFSWLTKVREADEYSYSHSMRSAIWAIMFGRHIGLSKKDMDALAIGVLLKDLGKVGMAKELLENDHRSAKEQLQYQSFVETSVAILRDSLEVEPRVIGVVKTHCERLNGTGFPHHLVGDKIPLLGKIAGIVTYYDETTNPRGEHLPLSPSKAVSNLYELRNVDFQEELVIEFIRAIGLYPTGTLVELTTGEVGVVVEQNFSRRLKPKVMLVLDATKSPLSKHQLLDMSEDDAQKQALIDKGKLHYTEVEKIEIAQDLEPGSFDIDITSVRDGYLFKREKKGWLSFLSRD